VALTLCLAGNEPRQQYLFAELARQSRVLAELAFDDIDPVTKVVAALLSYARPRSEWWGNYQMHPLVQRRRRRVLQRGLRRVTPRPDALLTWGSWFNPASDVPFFTYIDQSRSLAPLPGERPASRQRGERAHAMQAKTYQDAGAVFCMSQWARAQTLEAHDVPPDKVLAVGWGPCAVDLSTEAIPDAAREPLVLHVSNDFRRKGVDYLLATAERVAAVDPTIRFVVIGRDGSGLPVADTKNVTFTGPIYDRAQLADYFRRASLFFLPHRFDRSPHVLVEAMSAGLPLVTSAQGGASELVDGTGIGAAVAVGDVDGYAGAILHLMRDADARRTASIRARALMMERYNWPVIASRILERISRSRDVFDDVRPEGGRQGHGQPLP
jgi:glycosyltransferase involved in cell wall biosynthesis